MGWDYRGESSCPVCAVWGTEPCRELLLYGNSDPALLGSPLLLVSVTVRVCVCADECVCFHLFNRSKFRLVQGPE